MTKFMQSLDDRFYRKLERVAKGRGITVQALIRDIIPEWQFNQKVGKELLTWEKQRKKRLKKWRKNR